MKRFRSSMVTLVATILSTALWLQPLLAADAGQGNQAGEPSIAKLLEEAKTAEDHEKIAGLYDKQAAKAETDAKQYAEQMNCYNAIGRTPPAKMTEGMANQIKAVRLAAGWCRLQIRRYQSIAKENRDLANVQRNMAKALKEQGQ